MPGRLAPPLLLDVTPTVGLKGGRRIENVKRGTKCPHLQAEGPEKPEKNRCDTLVPRSYCAHIMSYPSFQSSCWASCCISYAIWKVLRFSACKKEHNASNIPLKLGHANLWSTYSPLQRYELFMKLPTFSCYFFIIYIHFFFFMDTTRVTKNI